MSAMTSSAVQIADDHGSLRVHGASFVAVDAPLGRCTAGPRCVFAVGFGCKLSEDSGTKWCQPGERNDGRSVVWVKPTH